MSEEPHASPRWGLVVAGLLLLMFTLCSLPSAIEVVRTPDRWHGFEVDWNWRFIYASPLLIGGGALMLYLSVARQPR